MAEMLLSLSGVRAGYGDAVVLNDVGFDLAEKGSLAVLGRNGVGKSTLLLTIMGFTRMTRSTLQARACRHRMGGAGARDISFAYRCGKSHRQRTAGALDH